MRDILSPQGFAQLQRFVGPDVLYAFDFDGTLAPIVAHPSRARVRAPTRRTLLHLATRARCAVISGRARADVAARLDGIPLHAVIGNHGLESGVNDAASAAIRRRVLRWRGALQQALDDERGWILEDKNLSLSLHYRGAANPAAVRARARAALARMRGVRVIGGKQVVNLLPARGANKGSALRGLCRTLRVDRAIFVGDDDTDEDVFALADPRRLLAIRVGRRDQSRAPWFVKDRDAVDRLLTRIARQLRTEPA